MYQTLRDWRSQLTGTFVFYPKGDKINVLNITKVLSPRGQDIDEVGDHHECPIERLTLAGQLAYKPMNKKDVHLAGVTKKGEGVYMDLPYLGMGNVNNYVTYTTYKVARQWKKSLTNNLVKVSCPIYKEIINIGDAYPDRLGSALVYSIVNREYYELQDAVRAIKDGSRLGCALSRHSCLVSKNKIEFPVLVYKTTAVGYVNKDKLIIPKEFRYLHEELMDIRGIKEEYISYE